MTSPSNGKIVAGVLAFFSLLFLAYIAFWLGCGYVVIHFLEKLW